ncbi:MAG: hypothetical protein GX561_00895 [Lentisphaerae bacterium]|nr:hypothetical protein [Lentisphaerota bacterium]
MRHCVWYAIAMISCFVAQCQDAVKQLIPDGRKPEVELVQSGGFEGKLSRSRDSLTISFKKVGQERRLISVRTVLPEGLSSYPAFEGSIVATFGSDQVVRPCVMFFEASGACWYRLGSALDYRYGGLFRLNLASLSQAAFSKDDNGQLDWDKIREVRVGVTVDGAGEGEVTLSQLMLTSQRYVPTKPEIIPLPKAKSIGKGADPAAKVSVEDVVIDGQHALHYSFEFPLNRHMYFVPSFRLPELDFASYSGLRLTYKASIPKPIPGLLVQLYEGGGSYYAPPPKNSDDFTTVDIKFTDFKIAGWAKKPGDDQELKLEKLSSISIGCHGSAAENQGKGTFTVKKLELIP